MNVITTNGASARYGILRQMLIERRRVIQGDVQGRLHDVRGIGSRPVLDEAEHSEADVRDDIDFALIQMNAETLVRIDAALVRLDADTYGRCAECDEEIADRRLRALPFAVRCRSCEERREQDEARQRKLGQRGDGLPLFVEKTI
jgi:RNA polymerase-binding transcription factor